MDNQERGREVFSFKPCNGSLIAAQHGMVLQLVSTRCRASQPPVYAATGLSAPNSPAKARHPERAKMLLRIRAWRELVTISEKMRDHDSNDFEDHGTVCRRLPLTAYRLLMFFFLFPLRLFTVRWKL